MACMSTSKSTDNPLMVDLSSLVWRNKFGEIFVVVIIHRTFLVRLVVFPSDRTGKFVSIFKINFASNQLRTVTKILRFGVQLCYEKYTIERASHLNSSYIILIIIFFSSSLCPNCFYLFFIFGKDKKVTRI